jgi:hypothetical protein
MNLKNDVILITAHAPDRKRRDLLRNLLYSIDREKFDVVISANSALPEEFFDLCDYIIFDKSNKLIRDYDKKIVIWWGNQDFYVNSSEIKSFNHLVAAQTLITNGFNWCKNTGYRKLHFLEYDSIINDDTVFGENSKLLENYSIVWYDHPAGHGLFSSYSVNLDKLPYFWFDTAQRRLEKFLASDEDKILEAHGMNLLKSTGESFQRSFPDYDNRVKTNLFNTDGSEDWTVILGNEGAFYCFVMNNTSEKLEVLFIVNNEKNFRLEARKGTWHLQEIAKITEADNVKILVDGNLKREYDFSKIDRYKFIEKNFMKKNK